MKKLQQIFAKIKHLLTTKFIIDIDIYEDIDISTYDNFGDNVLIGRVPNATSLDSYFLVYSKESKLSCEGSDKTFLVKVVNPLTNYAYDKEMCIEQLQNARFKEMKIPAYKEWYSSIKPKAKTYDSTKTTAYIPYNIDLEDLREFMLQDSENTDKDMPINQVLEVWLKALLIEYSKVQICDITITKKNIVVEYVVTNTTCKEKLQYSINRIEDSLRKRYIKNYHTK